MTVSTADFVLHNQQDAGSLCDWDTLGAMDRQHGQIFIRLHFGMFIPLCGHWVILVTVFYTKAQTSAQMFHISPPSRVSWTF